MTTRLLDVNVLIALIDPAHVQHDQAHACYAAVDHKAFATCPITENGLVRIVGHPRYPNSPGPPSAVLPSLAAIRGLPGHHFWPDDLSMADDAYFAADLLTSHTRVTDSHLLALAHAHRGRLATMEQKLATEVVAGERAALELIPPGRAQRAWLRVALPGSCHQHCIRGLARQHRIRI